MSRSGPRTWYETAPQRQRPVARGITSSVAGGRFPALEDGRLPIGADRLRAPDPGAELGLGELRVLLLELDPVRVPGLQVLDQHLARDLVLAALGNREEDLKEGVVVGVEDRGHAFLLEELDVLEPVDVLAGRRRQQVDVLDQGDVLLVREAAAREGLGVDLDVTLGAAQEVSPATGSGSTSARSRTASS